jgi:hypothetical protein
MKRFVLFLLLFCSCVLQISAGESNLPPSNNNYAKFVISCTKPVFSTCEPIIFSCTIGITIEKKIYFSQADKHFDFEINLIDSECNNVPLTMNGKDAFKRGKFTGPFSSHDYPLIKGDSITTQFLLNRYFDLT